MRCVDEHDDYGEHLSFKLSQFINKWLKLTSKMATLVLLKNLRDTLTVCIYKYVQRITEMNILQNKIRQR